MERWVSCSGDTLCRDCQLIRYAIFHNRLAGQKWLQLIGITRQAQKYCKLELLGSHCSCSRAADISVISHICRGGTTNLTNQLKALQKANFKSLETEQGRVLRVTLLPEQNLYRSCQSLLPGDAFILFIVKLGFLLPWRILFSSKFTVNSKLIGV